MSFMNKTLVVSAILIVYSGVVSAQAEQTAKGAQEFLAKLFAQGTTTLKFDYGLGINRVRPSKSDSCILNEEYKGVFDGLQLIPHCYKGEKFLYTDEPDYSAKMWVDVGSWNLKGATSEGDCKTLVQVEPKEAQFRNFTGKYRDHPAQYTLWSEPEGRPFLIDWTKAAGTIDRGSEVQLTGVSPQMYFVLPSKELAARVAYAMEFLRLNCDATAGTGF